MTDERKPTPERERTDESLRVERANVDLAVGDGLDDPSALDATADAVISTARLRADQIVADARARTDDQPATVTRGPQLSPAVAAARAIEDEVLRTERADADDVLRDERAKSAALLSIEREKTDGDLSRERERADCAVATRDEFLGIVSHDLRNILSSVIGFAGLIAVSASRENVPADILLHAQRIQRAGARMDRLVGDLIDVASIEAGVLAVTHEPVSPTQLVHEAMTTFQARATAKSISLVAELDGAPHTAAFDPSRILQVLGNLLGNAIKFTSEHGKVVLRVERIEDQVRFTVRDTGVGIPSDKLEAIFERFLQVKTGDRRGVGLGLYISKCIVDGHGGRIWAVSRLGAGSAFSFTLPIHFNAPPSRSAPPT